MPAVFQANTGMAAARKRGVGGGGRGALRDLKWWPQWGGLAVSDTWRGGLKEQYLFLRSMCSIPLLRQSPSFV